MKEMIPSSPVVPYVFDQIVLPFASNLIISASPIELPCAVVLPARIIPPSGVFCTSKARLDPVRLKCFRNVNPLQVSVGGGGLQFVVSMQGVSTVKVTSVTVGATVVF